MLSHKFVVLFHSSLFILLSVSFWLSGVQRKSHPRLVNLTCFPFIGRVRAPKHSFLYWGCWHFIFLRSWDEPKEKKNKYKTKSNPKGCTKSPPFISYKMPSIIYWNFYNSKKIQLSGTHVLSLFNNWLCAWRMDDLCVGINGSPKTHNSNLKLEKRWVICCAWDMLIAHVWQIFQPTHTLP